MSGQEKGNNQIAEVLFKCINNNMDVGGKKAFQKELTKCSMDKIFFIKIQFRSALSKARNNWKMKSLSL